MVKKDLIKPAQYKMNVSQDLLWSITRKSSSLRMGRKHVDFTRDPFSATNRNSRQNAGLVANGQRTSVAAGAGLTMTVRGKNTRKFVNATPRYDRKGNTPKGYKTPKTLKNFMFSSETMNDKNAAMTHANSCPMVRRRITKLHRANLRRARNSTAKNNDQE